MKSLKKNERETFSVLHFLKLRISTDFGLLSKRPGLDQQRHSFLPHPVLGMLLGIHKSLSSLRMKNYCQDFWLIRFCFEKCAFVICFNFKISLNFVQFYPVTVRLMTENKKTRSSRCEMAVQGEQFIIQRCLSKRSILQPDSCFLRRGAVISVLFTARGN